MKHLVLFSVIYYQGELVCDADTKKISPVSFRTVIVVIQVLLSIFFET